MTGNNACDLFHFKKKKRENDERSHIKKKETERSIFLSFLCRVEAVVNSRDLALEGPVLQERRSR